MPTTCHIPQDFSASCAEEVFDKIYEGKAKDHHMTIKAEALALCPSIHSSPLREDLRNCISGHSTRKYDSFGYNARMQKAQFLGFLMVNQERKALEQTFPQTIPPLDESARRLLAGIHNQITRLNASCISSLMASLPVCRAAVDPYNAFPYRASAEDGEVPLLTEEQIEKISNSFKEHPAIIKTIETAPAVPRMNSNAYSRTVQQLTESILRAGPFHAPKEVDEIWSMRLRPTLPADSQQRNWCHHFGALAGIRYSLKILDQIIFNAVLYDDFYTLDQKNIIDSYLVSSHVSGLGMLVTFLPANSRREDQLQLRELLWVEVDYGDECLNYLAPVEAISFEPSLSFGEGIRVALRAVEDNLNPLAYLLYL